MARPPSLAPEVIAQLRAVWENDPRPGFQWLINQTKVKITAPTLRYRAKKENWEKTGFSSDASNDENPKKKTGQKKTAAAPARGFARQPKTHGKDRELTEKQEKFAQALVATGNAARAAEAAGYSVARMKTRGAELRNVPAVEARVGELKQAAAESAEIDAKAVLRSYYEQCYCDISNIFEVRRAPCRFCWSGKNQPQKTLDEYWRQREAYEEKRFWKLVDNPKANVPEFPAYDGEWYDATKSINPNCPNCHGRGREELILHETRKLSPAAMALIQGIERDSSGRIKVILKPRSSIDALLARALGIDKPKQENVQINILAQTELLKRISGIRAEALERDRKMRLERGLPPPDEEDQSTDG